MLRSLLLSVAGAVVVAAFASGVALAADPPGVGRDAVATFLKRLNFPATLMTSEAGSPTIETKFGDIATTLQFGDCEGDPPVCKDIAFIATFDEVEVPDLAAIVARNGTWNFAKTYLDTDAGVPGAEMDLTLVSGNPELRLSAAIDIWRSLATGLADGFPAEPPESVLDTDVLASAMAASPTLANALFAPDPNLPESEKLRFVNPETLAAMLGELGYETRAANEDGSMIWIEVDGLKAIVSPRICNTRQNHCGLLSIVHLRDPRDDETFEKMNDFNVSEWFVRVFRAETGQTLFSFDAPVFDGLSLVDLERYLSIWSGTVAAYDAFLKGE